LEDRSARLRSTAEVEEGLAEMSLERERRYDTFVVRLWRDLVSRRVLRAEVEHVQSGHRVERHWSAGDGGGDGLEWIAEQIDGDADGEGDEGDRRE
jgi:hypothetical protein